MDNKTKQKVFEVARILIDIRHSIGFCSALRAAHQQMTGIYYDSMETILSYYPEIVAHKPKVTFDDEWWFSPLNEGRLQRLDILLKEINKLDSDG